MVDCHEINYCTLVSSVKESLSHYEDQRTQVLDQLDNGTLRLWTHSSPLSYDKKCQFSSNCIPQIQKTWRCVGCQSLYQLFEFQTKTPQLYTWDCGPEAGDPVHIEQHKLDILETKIEPTKYTFDTDVYTYRASDSFTQRILSTWCVQDIMKDSNMENYQQLYTAHACGDTGYLLTKHVNTYKDIPNENFFPQLFSILNLLNSIEYSFPEPKADNFGWIDKPIAYHYQGGKVENSKTLVLRVGNGPLTRILSDGTPLRLYDITEECDHKYYHQYLREKFVTSYKPEDEFYYLFGDSVRQILESQRAGFRFVGPCLDTYAIILDWMTLAKVQKFVLTQPKLKNWWQGLWKNTEGQIVLEQLRKHMKPLEILQGKHIRPDVLQYSVEYFFE